MSTNGHRIVLLGPQYHAPNLSDEFSKLDVAGDGPIAVVTAGWQEREGEDDELDRHLQGRSLDLEVYRRAERVYQADPDFRVALRAMQRDLREMEELYDLRLSYVVESVRRLLSTEAKRELVEPEQEHALTQLRELDAWHLERIRQIRGAFEEQWKPLDRDAVAPRPLTESEKALMLYRAGKPLIKPESAKE